jgi:hypothetical protein
MQEQEPKAGYTFYFQMSDGRGRLSCAVTVASPTRDQAEIIFRDNSSEIVRLARANIASRSLDTSPLRLNFP